MKKIIYLFLVLSISLITSCKSDDDAPNENGNTTDPIIGTWFFYSDNGELVDDCKAQSSLIFLEDGNSITEDYFENDMNECISDGASEEGEIIWSNNNNGTYRLTFDNDPEDFEDWDVDFSDNGETLTFSFDFEEQNDDGDTITLTEVIIYKK